MVLPVSFDQRFVVVCLVVEGVANGPDSENALVIIVPIGYKIEWDNSTERRTIESWRQLHFYRVSVRSE